MKNLIMLFGLFAAAAANLFSFIHGWDPSSDYDETEMVYATRCPQCPGFPSSPGVIQNDTACEERTRLIPCVTGWFKEKKGYLGALAVATKNPQLLVALVFSIVFEIASGLMAKQASEWERTAIRVVTLLCFASGLAVLFLDNKWPIVLACFFLAITAFISRELMGEGAVQKSAPE